MTNALTYLTELTHYAPHATIVNAGSQLTLSFGDLLKKFGVNAPRVFPPLDMTLRNISFGSTFYYALSSIREITKGATEYRNSATNKTVNVFKIMAHMLISTGTAIDILQGLGNRKMVSYQIGNRASEAAAVSFAIGSGILGILALLEMGKTSDQGEHTTDTDRKKPLSKEDKRSAHEPKEDGFVVVPKAVDSTPISPNPSTVTLVKGHNYAAYAKAAQAAAIVISQITILVAKYSESVETPVHIGTKITAATLPLLARAFLGPNAVLHAYPGLSGRVSS